MVYCYFQFCICIPWKIEVKLTVNVAYTKCLVFGLAWWYLALPSTSGTSVRIRLGALCGLGESLPDCVGFPLD